jgi:hypothetical protein
LFRIEVKEALGFRSVGNPSPIQGQNGSRPEDGSYEDDPEAGILLGAEAAEQNAHQVVKSLVRLAQRALVEELGVDRGAE